MLSSDWGDGDMASALLKTHQIVLLSVNLLYAIFASVKQWPWIYIVVQPCYMLLYPQKFQIPSSKNLQQNTKETIKISDNKQSINTSKYLGDK